MIRRVITALRKFDTTSTSAIHPFASNITNSRLIERLFFGATSLFHLPVL